MSPEMVGNSPGNDAAGMNFEETELTLGLPGKCRSQSSGGTKRGFSETVELKLGSTVDESCEDGENSSCLNERKLMDPVNGSEYVPTYEDRDGDWMLVGDVPWKMFVESCKRLRLMKSSEAIGLAPRTPSKCSSSSTSCR
ncbi:hypothetical protein RHMOL_Rhmol08G0292500 [Rhododendron molle]|uniref:Uncharacterized protein n=1 Tax=Rhododendron molle TaxID=49168 RepID=A0ACC0MTS5_RHOML|nr:hypothetical protein RHMOL_Rhmol08G0292500 [Rhododendron molle]